MKKIFAIIMAICFIASALCVTSFAADETTGAVVLTVSALKEDGKTVVKIGDYKIFDDGWNAAMALADNRNEMKNNGYDRIIVDLHADWDADDGQFTDNFSNGSGFNWDAIYFQNGVKMTLNMNGHTIDRGLTGYEMNGEVMYIDEDADVIINNGTVKGGCSENGAGGIHINDGARVTLNNVNIIENCVVGDDGAGIAVYDGAVLIMNGGSISNNCLRVYSNVFFDSNPYGALYINDSTVTLNNVTVSNNYTFERKAKGVAIYATDSTLEMTGCIVSGNAVAADGKTNAISVIAAYDSKLTIKDTDFINNASAEGGYDNAHLFYLEDSSMIMEGGKIAQNNPKELFGFEDTSAFIKNVTITENASSVIYVDNVSKKVNMTACTLGNNTPDTDIAEIKVKKKGTLVLTDCVLGDTTFENKDMVEGVGSIFGEGSVIMIISIVAIAASIASAGISLARYKKKDVYTGTNKAEDEE